MKRHTWTVEDLKYLDAAFPHRETSEICAHLGLREAQVDNQAQARRLRKSPEMAQKIVNRLAEQRKGNAAIQASQFKPGGEPWNKVQSCGMAHAQEVAWIPTMHGAKATTRVNGATITQHRMRG